MNDYIILILFVDYIAHHKFILCNFGFLTWIVRFRYDRIRYHWISRYPFDCRCLSLVFLMSLLLILKRIGRLASFLRNIAFGKIVILGPLTHLSLSSLCFQLCLWSEGFFWIMLSWRVVEENCSWNRCNLDSRVLCTSRAFLSSFRCSSFSRLSSAFLAAVQRKMPLILTTSADLPWVQ